MLLSVLSVVLAWKFDGLAFLSFIVVMSSGLYTILSGDPGFISSASHSLLFFLMCVLCAENIGLELFPWIAVLNAGVMFFYSKDGMLLNASMSGCFQACILPLATLPVQIILVASILYSGKNQPIALMFVALGLYQIRRRKWKSLVLAVMASCVCGKLLVHGSTASFLNSDGRTDVWRLAFDFFADQVNPFTGAGLGSFYVVGPELTMPVFHQPFLYLHSDWLQIGFEMGFLGLVTIGMLGFWTVYRVRKDEILFTSLMLFLCFGLANFPLHNPVSALFGAVLMWTAVQESKKLDQRLPD